MSQNDDGNFYPETIDEVEKLLWELTNYRDKKIALQAIKFVLENKSRDYTKKIRIEEVKVEDNKKQDLSSLSDEELDTYIKLQSKIKN